MSKGERGRRTERQWEGVQSSEKTGSQARGNEGPLERSEQSSEHDGLESSAGSFDGVLGHKPD